MSGSDDAAILWGVGALVLALSALSARRLSFGEILRSLLGWLVIGAAAWAIVVHRDRIESLLTGLGERMGLGTTEAVGDIVRITMSPDGHFWARVSLNGVSRRMLVDSGATITAVSQDTARAVGLEVGNAGFPVMINTANGTIAAQRATVDTVSVAGLDTRQLAVVVSPAFGNTDVLGMNFLSRLASWRVEGRTLILEPKRASHT